MLFKPVVAGCLVSASVFAVPGGNPLIPPSADILAEARTLVTTMRNAERGPYSGIRWFCADGSNHPAKPYPCTERGGGVQHAEYSPARGRLAALGWNVGTIVSALDWAEIWQPESRFQRLREMPLETYLETIDDGWVLHKARGYRGRIQLEDEEKIGRELLIRLFEQPAWARDNFLLARELVRVIPHGRPNTDRTREVRHNAQEIAEAVPSFHGLRIEVHSRPSTLTITHIRNWRDSHTELAPAIHAKADALIQGLEDLFGTGGRSRRLKDASDALIRYSAVAAQLIREAREAIPSVHIGKLAQAMALLREDVNPGEPRVSLRRLDLIADLEAELRTSALEYLATPLSRRALLELARDILTGAYGGGWLNRNELQVLQTPLQAQLTAGTIAIADYAFATRRLALAGVWASQTLRFTYAEPLQRYTALDPRAARFVDDLLRESLLLPLGELAHRLTADGAQATGIEHRVFGQNLTGLLGINPGLARGRLRIVSIDDAATLAKISSDDIVVLNETVADLNPVAGILTQGEGNPLSHVQMLARNLGIPNVVIGPRLMPVLQAHADDYVLLAVSSDGRVLLEASEPLPVTRETVEINRVDAPRPQPGADHPLPLNALSAALAGKVVGPKAANVGELNRLFPGRIAPALALPFGVFAAHTTVARLRLATAFAGRRSDQIDQDALDAELDVIRTEVATTPLHAELLAELEPLMTETFGAPGSYGIFVRSDTNVEDLPQFTGAGLNLTLPNVVGLEHQLRAVSEVWASIYTRRAMAWRGRILNDPENVFASVLLMKSVPSEKSGVMVTTNLNSPRPGLTVSTAWGVGGAVDNESAASRVLYRNGDSLLLAEAKAAYKRVLAASGGVAWVPAETGSVLTPAEQNELRQLAAEVTERYPPTLDAQGIALPWDIEFAFADGKLWLLQIRPLVQRGRFEADQVLNQRIPIPTASAIIDLDTIPTVSLGI